MNPDEAMESTLNLRDYCNNICRDVVQRRVFSATRFDYARMNIGLYRLDPYMQAIQAELVLLGHCADVDCHSNVGNSVSEDT